MFLFNIRLQATQQDAGIVSMRRQMVDDDEIIRLRGNIRRAAEAKVQNGTMTVTDYAAGDYQRKYGTTDQGIA